MKRCGVMACVTLGALGGCRPRSPAAALSEERVSAQVLGVPFFVAPPKATWVFHHSSSPLLLHAEEFLDASDASWAACHNAEVATEKCRGEWGVGGLLFAEDPFVSAAYGATLLAARVKPEVEIPSLRVVNPGPGLLDEISSEKRAELNRSDVAAVRFAWAGMFSGDALMVRNSRKIFVTDSKGKREVHSYSPPRDLQGRFVGTPFAVSPSLRCEKGESLEQRLKKAVYHPYFMRQAAKEIRARLQGRNVDLSLLSENGQGLSTYGKIWAVLSEINGQVSSVRRGLELWAKSPVHGALDAVTAIDQRAMEYFEVFVDHKFKDGEEVDPSYPAWFRSAGFLKSDQRIASLLEAHTLGEALAAHFSAEPVAAERAREAYGLAECILEDLSGQNMGNWSYKESL